MNRYNIHPAWLGRTLNISVVGAGGTGSIMLGVLAQMAVALQALGHPGVDVSVIDDDVVSAANIGRQAFFPPDIGQPKASVLVNRINQSFGLNFTAHVERLVNDPELRLIRELKNDTDIWIGCVDSRKARKAIHGLYTSQLERWSSAPVAWIDCGNSTRTGQVVLGLHEGPRESPNTWGNAGHPMQRHRREVVLPCVADLFAEAVDESADSLDDAPSCSLAEALRKQDLFTNRMVCDTAVNLLWQLLRHGQISSHGAFINLETMRINPMAINPAAWKRLGFELAQPGQPEVQDQTQEEEAAA